jgi:nucleoid-associated protein YgaU
MLQGTRRKGNISLVLLACVFAVGIAPSYAQSLADIARAERERQKNIAHPATHVYTNDDLQREQILIPQDRKEFQADHKIPASVAEPTFQAILPAQPQEIPLGDVARHYRLLEQLQEIQQADKTDVLPVKKPALAAPTLTPPAVISIPRPHWKQPKHFDRPEFRENVTLANANRILINQGDTLWMLAARYLGNGIRWHKILAVNPQLKNPNLIRAGEWLALPLGVSETPAGSETLSGKIRVQKGDTLWGLAQLNFGSGLAYSCIAEANPSIPNVNRIYSGQVINLPAHCNSIR